MQLSAKDDLGPLYKIMVASIVPRPIAWVSTLGPDGQPNLAPFSFFNAVCSRPPTLLFASGVRGVDGQQKDTGLNAAKTGEFVINVVTEELAEAMNKTATELPPDVNEFEYAGLEAAPSVAVAPPRVAASPVAFECKVSQIVQVGDGAPGSGYIVIGEVLYLHVDDAILAENYRVNTDVFHPIGRMSGPRYAKTTDVFELFREPSQIEPN